MKFLAFLIVGFSGSNAALLPANFLDNPDLSFPSSPLLDPPLPGSLSLNQAAPGNEPSPSSLNLNAFDPENNPTSSSPLLDSPLPGSLLLNQPAPGNDPSPFSLNLNAFDSVNNPTSMELAQQPNKNGVGDGGEFSTVTPSITYAKTQPQTDNSNGLCSLDGTTDQKRRKRESSFCVAPGTYRFHVRTPTQPPKGSTPQEKEKDKALDTDIEWISKRFIGLFGSNWREKTEEELYEAMKGWSPDEKDACAKQSMALSKERLLPFCCIGPPQKLPSSLLIGLAPRQEASVINWFNCEWLIPGRPYCHATKTTDVCCRRSYVVPDLRNREPGSWWRWGFKGVDCVNLRP